MALNMNGECLPCAAMLLVSSMETDVISIAAQKCSSGLQVQLSIQQRCQQCTHAPPVRTLPVNPLAAVAAQEVRIERANPWRHLQAGQFRADLVQRQVAMKAQAERSSATRQVQAFVDFTQLQRLLQSVHVTAVADDAPLEQLAVTGQHDAPLRCCDLGDLA